MNCSLEGCVSVRRRMMNVLLFISFGLLTLFCFQCNAKDYCVIGAGPSGLQMGYFLDRAGRDYMIYERDPSAGWFYKVYPRHRTLISINKRFTGKTNKEFNMRHDWNSLISDDNDLLITKYTKDFFPKADLMVQYLNDYATKLKLKIQYNTYIRNVTYNTDNMKYKLKDKNGTQYDCKVLIMSTGMWVENIPIGVNGIELTEGYPKMSVNPDDYEGKNVLIIGRGNSGFETAQNLLQATNVMHMMSRNRVRFAWETHYVGDLRAVNGGPIDTYMLKSLDGQFETDLSGLRFVKKDNGKIYVFFKDDTESIDNLATRQGYHHILRCTGFKFDRSIFNKDCRPNRSPVGKKYPAINHGYESTTSKHMFFTGVTTHSLDWRKSAGGFIHGYRYTTRALHRYLEWRYEGVPWPSTRLPVKDLSDLLIKRLNEASGIYQMLSALTDVILLRDDGTFEYLEEVGVGMLPDLYEYTGKNFTRGSIVLNLEYGKNFSGAGRDTFHEQRATGDPQEAHTSNFLHPVLYYYKGAIPALTEDGFPSRPDRIHHMVEDFLTEWVTPVSHIMPLRWFLEYCIGDDLRSFYADTCFEYAMTGVNVPVGCVDYLKGGHALPRASVIPDV